MKFKREKKKKHRETEKQNHWAELKWFSHWTNVSIGLDIDWSILICVTNGGFITFSFLKKNKIIIACQIPSLQSNIHLRMGPILFIDVDWLFK